MGFDSWFTWWFNHLPGPSIAPERTPMVVGGVQWFVDIKMRWGSCPPTLEVVPQMQKWASGRENLDFHNPDIWVEVFIWNPLVVFSLTSVYKLLKWGP